MTKYFSKKKTVIDSRASAILYRFLSVQTKQKTIILPVNICPIVPAVIKHAGFPIEYVDINKNDLCPDENIIYQKIKALPEKYSGILYNYTYGIDINKELFYKLLKENFPNLWIIEDKCSNLPNKHCSKFADLTIFSTGYAKQIDLGKGGFGIITKDINLDNTYKEKFEILTANGKQYLIETQVPPFMQEQYFELISTQIKIIQPQKNSLNNIYRDNLPVEIQMENKFNNWRFNIMVKNKSEILYHLFANNLFASSHFEPLSSNKTDFPVAFNLHNQVINLFNDSYYTTDQAFKTCEIINKYL